MGDNLLLNKFKDRSPEDTVALLKDFFEKRGFLISQEVMQSEIGTWSCRISILMNGLIILGANGKGVTESFALASGYSELFERFCNKNNYIANPFFNKKIDELRPEYRYEENERLVDPFLMVRTVPLAERYFKAFLKTDERIAEFLQVHYPEGAHAVEFCSLDGENESLWLDPSIMNRVTGSNGMASGNTLEEALNQGLSELYERRGSILFYQKNQLKYKAVDLNTVPAGKYKDAVDKMRETDYKLIVLDLSCNFDIPVLAGILIDTLGLTCRINFSSFPIFDIAFERILTELYQGISNMRQYGRPLQTPGRATKASFILNNYGNNYTQAAYLPDEFIMDKIEYVSYNTLANFSNVFLPSQDKDNATILTYYKELGKKLGQNFYYHNFSLIPDKMAAVYIIAPTFYSIEQIRMQNAKNISPLLVEGINLLGKLHMEIVDKTINLAFNFTSSKYHEELLEIWNNYYQLCTDALGQHYGNLVLSAMDVPIPDMETQSFGIFAPLTMIGSGQCPVGDKHFLYPYFKLYASIMSYKNNFYTTEEIHDIFLKLFDKDLNEMQINGVPELGAALLDCYFYPVTSLYNSDIYNNVVKAYIERG